MLNRIFWICKGICKSKLRAFLVIISVSIGVLSVVLIGNISSIATRIIDQNLNSIAGNSIIISSYSSNDELGFSDGDLRFVKSSDEVKSAMPIIIEGGSVLIKSKGEDVYAWGATDEKNQALRLEILYGRNLENSDIASNSNVCMVEEKFSNKHYGRNNIIGRTLSLELGGITEEFKIVGIVKSNTNLIQNTVGSYVTDFVYIPYTSLMQMTSKCTFDQLGLEVSPGYDSQTVGNRLLASMKGLNHEEILERYKITDVSEQRGKIEKLLEIVSLVLSIIAGISLFVATLSIMTIMLVSVKERKNEIGIKKSIGANKKDIFLEFMIEAMMITLMGCLVGVVLGTILPFIATMIINVPFVFNIYTTLLAVLFAVISSMLFGIYPAMKAAALKPVEALRRD